MSVHIVVLMVLLIVALVTIVSFLSEEYRRCSSYIEAYPEYDNQQGRNVDFVITWVDSSDVVWQQKKKTWNLKIFGADVEHSNRFPLSNNPCRELKTAVNSVLRYLPWIRSIIIVTQRPQRPAFVGLDVEQYEKVRIVHHDEIFEHLTDLPTFNSHAIESNIHRIPGLSECFIYSNDDVYIVRHMVPSDFFDRCGRPLVCGDWLPQNMFLNLIKQLQNCGHIRAWGKLNEVIGTSFIFRPSHTCMPLTISLALGTEHNNKVLFRSTSSTRFRQQKKLQIPPIGLALNYGLFHRAVLRSRELKLKMYANVLTDRFPTVCLNLCLDTDKLDLIDKNFLSPNPRRSLDVGGAIVMFVAHCGDELLFGASTLLLSQTPVKILVLAEQSMMRRRELADVVAKINMDGGNVEVLNEFGITGTSLHARQELVNNITKRVRNCPNVARILSYDENSEYVQCIHMEVQTIARDVAESIPLPIITFQSAWKSVIPRLDDSQKNDFIRQRMRLLRNYGFNINSRYDKYFPL